MTVKAFKKAGFFLSAAVCCILAVQGAAFAQRANIALSKATAASGTESGLPSSNVVDGDTNTRWSSYGNTIHNTTPYDTEWIYVNLGASFTVDSIHLLWNSASATTYDVQYSNSTSVPTVDSVWKKCFSVANRDTINDKWQLMPIKLASPVVARFIRVKAYKPITFYNNGALIHYGYSMREFRVFAYDSAKIVTSPFDLALPTNQVATFSVTAKGFPAPSYQWQKSIDTGKTFTNVTAGTGANTRTYTFTTASTDSGSQFRCLVWNALDTAISAAATLVIVKCTPLQIAIDPPATQSVSAGASVQLSVTITPDATTPVFQWQRSNDNGLNFANVTTGTGGTTALYSFTAAQSDNGAKFRCIVFNLCSKDTSVVSALAVCTRIAISSQPKDTIIRVGQNAVFGVVTSGTATAFQWQRSALGPSESWTPVSGATSATYTLPVTLGDTAGAKFKCVVRGQSPCGDTVSRAATMTVCIPCSLKAQSVGNSSVLAGATVNYSVTATGSNVAYQWQKRRPGLTTWDTIPGARSASYSLTAAYSDSGAAFRCMVTGLCGSVTSATGVLTVYVPVDAQIWTRDTLGPIPLSVSFFDSSKGSYNKRKWIFGDNSAVDSVTKNPAHVYGAINTFTVRLIVSGPGGTDTATRTVMTWAAGTNPMQLAGRYLLPPGAVGDSQKAEIVIKNYNAISAPTPQVTVDSIGLWFKNGKIPTRPDSAVYRRTYALLNLKLRGDQYVDTIAVPTLRTDSLCGFVTGIFWSDQKGKPTTFTNGNGVLVLMRDTLTPANNLTVSGGYFPRDTARLTIAGISSIDTNRVDSMFVWYGLTNDSANFCDRNATRGVSMKDVYKSVSNNQYQISLVNQAFFAGRKTAYFAVIVVGKNKRASPAEKCSFSVGVDRPQNPLTLRARALSATRIRLSWNDITSAAVERIIIWCRAGKAVDTVYDVSALKLDSLVPASLTDTVIIGNNFNQKTHYYFGAQVFKGGLWSQITKGASAGDSTPEAGAKLDSNTVHLVKPAAFDTSTNTITIKWTVNRAVADSLDIGISYSTVSMPSQDTSVGQVINVTGGADSALIKLRQDLAFNTTYYVAVWLRRPGGKWTDPTKNSSDTVRIPSFTWQSVTYFTKDKDTVFAFNRELRLLNQPGDVSKTTEIVRYMTVPAFLVRGFVRVSMGVEFPVKNRTTQFLVGLKIDSLPAGCTLADIRVYQDSAGRMKLMHDSLIYDATNRYVSVLTNDLDFPLFAMVDKTGPTHQTISHPDVPVPAQQDVTDTVIIRDNCANMNWRLLAARGHNAYDTLSRKVHGTCGDTVTTLMVTSDAEFVSQESGLRALLIVDDGIHYDTVVLSRCVKRDGSDYVVTEAQKWVPLFVAAVLDTPDVRYVLRSLSADNSEWKYDNTEFRVFRSFPDAKNEQGWRWVEYADSISGMFDVAPGNIEWVKSKVRDTVWYGPSTTVSLKEPKGIRLPPKSWTDFAIPYRFDINIGDILTATGQGSKSDSLQIYSWKKDTATSLYTTEMVYFTSLPDQAYSSRATALSADVSGYTVFNPLPDTIVLKIPPIPTSMSTEGLPKKTAVCGWAVRIASSLEGRIPLGTVYCGYSGSRKGAASFYPQAPSFCSVRVGVMDEDANRVFGHSVTHDMSAGGCAYKIAFVNYGSERQRVLFHVENQNALPQGLRAAVYNAKTGAFEDFSKGDAAATVEPLSKEYRLLLVGTEGFLASAQAINAPTLRLIGTYPNPFRAWVKIRYSLPSAGISKVKFTICDLRGSVLWRYEMNGSGRLGAGELVWRPSAKAGRTIAAGIYVLRMSAYGAGQHQTGVFERKMTLMP